VCWKQEWASAIGNIQTAIRHIERAQAKLERRREKAIDNLGAKCKDKWASKLISKRIIKNTAGITECQRTIAALEAQQAKLHKMIQSYGITNEQGRGQSKRLVRNMGRYKSS
jgi:hypothetical protein